MYEIIDHTADIGIRVQGGSMEEVFLQAADAMFDLMIGQKRPLIPAIEVPLRVEAAAPDELLVRWLSELLFLFESRRLVLTRFWIDRIDGRRLEGAAKGLKFDETRHTPKLVLKAVTYHGLKLEKGADGLWKAEVIFDL